MRVNPTGSPAGTGSVAVGGAALPHLFRRPRSSFFFLLDRRRLMLLSLLVLCLLTVSYNIRSFRLRLQPQQGRGGKEGAEAPEQKQQPQLDSRSGSVADSSVSSSVQGLSSWIADDPATGNKQERSIAPGMQRKGETGADDDEKAAGPNPAGPDAEKETAASGDVLSLSALQRLSRAELEEHALLLEERLAEVYCAGGGNIGDGDEMEGAGKEAEDGGRVDADTTFWLDMLELAARTITVPRFGINDEPPASVLLGSESSNAMFARSITDLEEIQQRHARSANTRRGRLQQQRQRRRGESANGTASAALSPAPAMFDSNGDFKRTASRHFVYRLEGTRTTTVTPVLTRGFSSLQPGWFCLSVIDSKDFCIIGSMPFVVADGDKRQDSEYGVSVFSLIDLYRPLPLADGAQQQKLADAVDRAGEEQKLLPSGKVDADATTDEVGDVPPSSAWIPQAVVYGMPVPVLLRAPSIERLAKAQALRHPATDGHPSPAAQTAASGDAAKALADDDLSFLRYGVRTTPVDADHPSPAEDPTAPSFSPSVMPFDDAETGAGALQVEMVFGAASFWLIPGAAYLEGTAAVAQSQSYGKKRRELERLHPELAKQQQQRSAHKATADGSPLGLADTELPLPLLARLFQGHYWHSRRAVLPYHDGDARRHRVAHLQTFMAETTLRSLRDGPAGGIAEGGGQRSGKDKKKGGEGGEGAPLPSAATLLHGDCVPKDIFHYSMPHLVVPEARRRVPEGKQQQQDPSLPRPAIAMRQVPVTVAVTSHKHMARVTDAVGLLSALQQHAADQQKAALSSSTKEDVSGKKRNAGKASSSYCIIKIGSSLAIGGHVTVPPVACTILLAEQVVLTILQGADVTFAGTDAHPLLFTAAPCGVVGCAWGGFLVQTNARLHLERVMLTAAGSRNVKREPNTGSHIKDRAPAITAAKGAVLSLRHAAVLNCAGPAFALGPQSTTTIDGVVIQDVAQGGECVQCTVTLTRTHITDIPYANRNYGTFVDKDNDGFYFRGGTGVMNDSVIAYAMDDGIDSACSAGDAFHSTLNVASTVITMCQHEGIALSSSTGNVRTVSIADSTVAHCQQGVENGHSSIGHSALLTHTLLYDNHIGLRHGDNYNLDVQGNVTLDGCTFLRNDVSVLGHSIREHATWLGGPGGKHKALPRNPAEVLSSIHNPLVGSVVSSGPNVELQVRKAAKPRKQEATGLAHLLPFSTAATPVRLFLRNCTMRDWLETAAAEAAAEEKHGEGPPATKTRVKALRRAMLSTAQREPKEMRERLAASHEKLTALADVHGTQCGMQHYVVLPTHAVPPNTRKKKTK